MIVVGVDVGNSTTEAVVIDGATRPPTVLAADRAPTRGAKGSAESLRGAAMLVTRLQRRLGRPVDLVAAAPQRPVTTGTVSMAQSAQRTGRLDVVPAGGQTPGGVGVAVGVPRWALSPPRPVAGPVILLVPSGAGYRAAVDAVDRWTSAGTEVAGVLLADDEGVLVASRVAGDMPVADLVDVERVSTAGLVAVEVRAPGHPLQTLGDPIRLSAALGLSTTERNDALGAAEALGDASRGVVALHPTARPSTELLAATVWLENSPRRQLLTASLLAQLPVGAVRRWLVPDGRETDGQGVDVDDLWAVGLREVAASVAAPVEASTARDLVVAALQAHPEVSDPGPLLRALLDVPVRVGPAEAVAARAGGLTTPGVHSAAVVVDLGGGTVDVIDGDGARVIAAGAGELLTAAVSRYLELPLGAADWVKRGPCSRVESPQVLLAEDGTRTFLERPVDAGAVGLLAVQGPAGLLPFGGTMAPSAWRALRRRLKERVIADNVSRALSTAQARPSDLLLVGGAAGDEELLGLLRSALPGCAVGRADVAGGLGHRYAVAYGLALLATREHEQETARDDPR
jgi:hypothetical protein